MKLDKRYSHQKDLLQSFLEFRAEVATVLEALDFEDDDGLLAIRALECLAATAIETAGKIRAYRSLPD